MFRRIPSLLPQLLLLWVLALFGVLLLLLRLFQGEVLSIEEKFSLLVGISILPSVPIYFISTKGTVIYVVTVLVISTIILPFIISSAKLFLSLLGAFLIICSVVGGYITDKE